MILIFGLVACTPNTTSQVPGTILPSTLSPTRPSTLTPTLSPTPHPTPTLTHSPTPTEHRTPIAVCSPLAVLTLEQIPKYVTQPFIAPSLVHNAEHPEWVHKDDGHQGTDIGYYQIDGKLFTGTPVLAALNGRIAAIIHDRPPYGDMLIVETSFDNIPPMLTEKQQISTGSSLYTLYAHLQNLQKLNIGTPVTCGQQIAETGLTGFTGGPHLHFETRWGPPGQTFASMAYYRADATKQEMENYTTWRMTAMFNLFDAMELLKDEG
jgi:murein DD-endopeptidase MepM/ murein hydrolase activator NlpD